MSHEITEREDGTAEAAFVLTPAWHGLGTVVDHAMTSAEALKAAQLDWRVEQRQLYAGTDEVLVGPDGSEETRTDYTTVPGMANIREDTGHFLGMVGPRYVVVQNTEAFDFLDALYQDDILRYESAFSLNGGRSVVILARMPEVDRITDQGDDMKRYIAFSTDHGGFAAIQFGPTAVRIVCANTYRMALGRGGISALSIRHTQSIHDKLADAKAVLGLAVEQFDGHADQCRKLAAAHITRNQWLEYLDVIAPRVREIDPDYTPIRQKRIDETREAITEAWNSERQQMDGTRGTAWAAWNAVTEHIDHMPRRGASERTRMEARFRVTQSGTGHELKERAFKAALKLAAVAN